MRTTKSYSLDEEVVTLIEKYKEKHDLQTVSAALERIILVEFAKQEAINEIKKEIKSLISNISANQIIKENIEEKQEQSNNTINPILQRSFIISQDDMAD